MTQRNPQGFLGGFCAYRRQSFERIQSFEQRFGWSAGDKNDGDCSAGQSFEQLL